ncbi:hypothetical protein OAH44_03270 [Acidimicrobiia bacterium]|nr:hypothetical protein [Acidimicrobiia bacterium]
MSKFFLGLTFIIVFQFAIVGLVIAAIARLLIPGPNPMTWGKTAIIGIAGSFFGGIIASVLGLEDLFATLIQVGSAATIILYLERR